MSDREAEMRTRITEAAKKLIFHYGFQKTTMADIAKEADISVGGLYNYFKNKEEISLACCKKCKLELFELMEVAATGPEAAPEKIKKVMLTRNLGSYDYFKGTQHGFEIVTSVMSQNAEQVKKIMSMEVELIARVFSLGVDRGELGPAAKKEGAAETFLTAFASFCPPLCFNLSEDEIREGTTQLVDMLMPGLKGN